MLFLPPDVHIDGDAEIGLRASGVLPWRMALMLCCPSCHSELEVRGTHATDHGVAEGTLVCESRECGAAFPIRHGIPDLMPARLLHDSRWQEWGAHLSQFQKRRELRVDEVTRLTSRLHTRKRGLQREFVRFAGITHGVVLDVGCGPGKLRFQFDPAHVEYFGVDPMPLPETADFPYARAVAEFIPFKNAMFTDVLVVSALDHFRDCNAFFAEVSRVLEPGGRLHVVQSVHEPRNPLKLATHWVKDTLEDRVTARQTGHAPHHMYEFTRTSFLDRVAPWFTVVNEATYAHNWYSPNKLFLTLARR